MATLIVMPRLSPTMEEGVLAKWVKSEGDRVAPGDIIAEVETDKANMDFPLEDEGVLLKQLARPGETVKLGAPVGILGDKGEDIAGLLASLAGASPAPSSAPAPAPAAPVAVPVTPAAAPVPAPPMAAAPSPTGRLLISPLARRLADDLGVDVRSLSGSGPGGRIIKRDIEQAAARGPSPVPPAHTPPAPAAPASPVATSAPMPAPVPSAPVLPASIPGAPDETVSLPMIRRTAAKRLVEAKQRVPHFYLTSDATVDALLDLREQINASLAAAGGEKISVNDLIIKALARALRVVPAANMSIAPDGQSAILHHRIDISVAVALAEGDGLITPVVRGADQKSVGAISAEVRELATRGRAKRLRPEEYTGGTFSISNLGMYGIREFLAIVNPPESGILAVGKAEKRPVVIEKDGKDEIRIQRRMTLTLSCDHRVIDGALGARLLAEVVKGLEHPFLLVI